MIGAAPLCNGLRHGSAGIPPNAQCQAIGAKGDSRTLFFVDDGIERGVKAALARAFERWVNTRHKAQPGKRPVDRRRFRCAAARWAALGFPGR